MTKKAAPELGAAEKRNARFPKGQSEYTRLAFESENEIARDEFARALREKGIAMGRPGLTQHRKFPSARERTPAVKEAPCC